MCGIAGLYLSGGTVSVTELQGMSGRLAHRGPDDTGLHLDGPLGIGQTRLSIIDLAGGHQPLFSADRELALVANGEIYNHVELRAKLTRLGHSLLTHSDCETILHAYAQYGDALLEHLHGMFAFALYDRGKRRLLLARDRLGIKPLFIAHLANGIAFASEIKALLPLLGTEPALDPTGIVGYLQNQFSTEGTTIVRGIERVLPGEALCIEDGQLRKRWRYWSALAAKPVDTDFEEAQGRFDRLMDQVMLEHMRSDVPFGLFLSGGVDSAILLALLNRFSTEPIRTFSVGFADTRLHDELPVARTLAKRFSSRHSEIRPSRDDILHSLPHTVWAADELMRDYANLPTALLAQAAGQELKVVFSGEGGDEVFAGYGRYRSSRLERWAKNLMHPGSGGFRSRGTFRGRWPERLFNETLLEIASDARRPFRDAWRATPADWTDLQRMQYTDLVTALPDNLLVKLDRMLMASGVEGRVPFLDHRVVEFGLSLPDRLKVEGRQGKAFLKRWALRYLPEEHLFAPKRGFHVPVGEWMRGDFVQRLRELLPRHPAIRAWFRPAGVVELLDGYAASGPVNRMVWALLQLAVWYELFIRGDGSPPPARQDPLELISG